ncbi:MAG: hypothetical protein ACKKL5_02635 [Candidatus Komeilibacteria bacterium]
MLPSNSEIASSSTRTDRNDLARASALTLIVTSTDVQTQYGRAEKSLSTPHPQQNTLLHRP